MDSNETELVPADAVKAEKRTPHSIRFLDPEWERIEAFADERGLTGPEFVRFAALAAIGSGSGASPGSGPRDRLAPLIEMTFRATYMSWPQKCATRCSTPAARKSWTNSIAAARGAAGGDAQPRSGMTVAGCQGPRFRHERRIGRGRDARLLGLETCSNRHEKPLPAPRA